MDADCPPTIREIAKQVRRCPFCASDSYVALFEDTRTGYSLRGVQCERCEGDILACFLSLPPAGEASGSGQRGKTLSGLLSFASAGVIAILGWLILLEWGWV